VVSRQWRRPGAGTPPAGGGGWIRTASAAGVFVAAFALRAAFLLSVPQPGPAHLGLYAPDSLHYLAMARRLLEGGGYSYWGGSPDAYVSPGYPLLVAGLFHLFPGAPLAAVRWCQVLLGAATAGVAALWAGILPGILVALYPSFIWSTGGLLSEVPFLFLFVSYLALHARLLASDRPRPTAALLTGAVLGLCVLTRPVVAPVPVVIAVVEWLSGRRTALGWGGLAGILAGAALVNLPWWLRNLLVLHRLVLFSQEAANPLVGGLSPDGAQFAVPPGESPYHFAAAYVAAALHANAGGFLHWMTIGKWRLSFDQAYAGGTANGGFLQALAGGQVALCWAGVAGLLVAAMRSPRLRPACTAAGTLTLMMVAFIPNTRYAYPVMALLAVGAGFVVACVISRLGQLVRGVRRRRRPPTELDRSVSSGRAVR
jgi:hypothetical protein